MSKTIASAVALFVLSAVSVSVAAQSVRVKCETRSNRAKISVDGSNLVAGQYSAVALSGSNRAQSPLAATVGDQAEFDFDSNARDIRQGATAIPANFIVGGKATGQILNAAGVVVAQETANCRRK